MIYIGIAPGKHGNIFMCLPNNIVFTFVHADFNESLFPRCSNRFRQPQIPLESNTLPSPNPLGSNNDDLLNRQTPNPSHARKQLPDNGIGDDNHQAQPPVQNQSHPPSNRDEDERQQIEYMLSLPRCNPP